MKGAPGPGLDMAIAVVERHHLRGAWVWFQKTPLRRWHCWPAEPDPGPSCTQQGLALLPSELSSRGETGMRVTMHWA
jgi:hypothetical protein